MCQGKPTQTHCSCVACVQCMYNSVCVCVCVCVFVLPKLLVLDIPRGKAMVLFSGAVGGTRPWRSNKDYTHTHTHTHTHKNTFSLKSFKTGLSSYWLWIILQICYKEIKILGHKVWSQFCCWWYQCNNNNVWNLWATATECTGGKLRRDPWMQNCSSRSGVSESSTVG